MAETSYPLPDDSMVARDRPGPRRNSIGVWIHRLAVLTSAATFLLIVMGGLVTSKGAGLVVPDWPTTYGQNPFLYPWSRMVGGVFYEHGHRLLGSLVGLLTLGLTIMLLGFEKRRWLRGLGIAAFVLVVVQGVLGGARVVLLSQTIAMVHASVAQGFFALTLSLALFTSRGWGRVIPSEPSADHRRLVQLATWTTLLIYLQVILGAVLRHTGAGIAAHLLVAAAVAIHGVLLVGGVVSTQSSALSPQHSVSARVFLGLLAAQLLLGFASYGAKAAPSQFPVSLVLAEMITAFHVAIGALLFGSSLILTLQLRRLVHQADGVIWSNLETLVAEQAAR